MLFYLYKGLDVTQELFKKIIKNELQNCCFELVGCRLTEYDLENSNFWAFSFDLLKEFVSDVQTFIEVKQHPQVGSETPHTMCEKFEDFWKNSIFDYFLNFSHGAPPHGC